MVRRSYERLDVERRKAVTEDEARRVIELERMYALRDALHRLLRAYMTELDAYELAYRFAETLTSSPKDFRGQAAEGLSALDDEQYTEALANSYRAIRISIDQWGDL